ncbi:unnamed protein product [Alternaria alternata]
MFPWSCCTKETQVWACLPVEASWNYSLRPPPLGNGSAKCFSRDTFGRIALFNAVINCLTDFLLALLPVPLIWQLKLNVRTRMSLIAILSLGVFAGAAGVFRATVFNTILHDPRRFVHDKWMMWNYVELTVGIIAGSLPALKPLFLRVLNAARERTAVGTGRVTGSGRPDTLGYERQDQSKSGIALSEYRSGNRASGTAMERPVWRTESRNDSDESVIPLHGPEGKANAIFVAKEFHIR